MKDEDGWDSVAKGRERHRFLEGREMNECPIEELVGFLQDYPNVSNVFIVRRLVARVAELAEERNDLRIKASNLEGRLKPSEDIAEIIESLEHFISSWRPFSPEGQVLCGAQELITAQSAKIAELETSIAEGKTKQ